MPQSLTQNYIHLVWSTKNGEPIIEKSIQKQLWAYMSQTLNNMECYSLKIGGTEDHIHILCLLSKTMSHAKVVEKVKSSSSKWIKSNGVQFQNFYWQRGYGAFSVNPRQIDIVVKYILNQEAHHKKKTFQEEYRAFLKKYKTKFDEKYVWD